jgi:hypothetical protein
MFDGEHVEGAAALDGAVERGSGRRRVVGVGVLRGGSFGVFGEEIVGHGLSLYYRGFGGEAGAKEKLQKGTLKGAFFAVPQCAG